MTTALSLSTAQFRLARHYVDVMRRANAAIQRGHGNRAYWYNRIEQDWGQIRHWQTWSAEASEADREHSQVCLDFSIQGLEILRVRQSPPERIAWLRQALEVAQRIDDGAAERTILHELGHTYFLIGEGDEAEQTAQHLLEIAEASKDDFNIGRAWYVLGQVGIFRGTLDVAEDAFRKSVVLLERAEAEAELGRAFQGMGRTAMYRGDNQSAYDYFLRYLNIVEDSGREAEQGPAYLTMSSCLAGNAGLSPGEDLRGTRASGMPEYGLSTHAAQYLAHSRRDRGRNG